MLKSNTGSTPANNTVEILHNKKPQHHHKRIIRVKHSSLAMPLVKGAVTAHSSLAPQHHQLLLPLWFKMRTLWMVLWEEESVGTVQLRDVYQGVV